MRRTRKKERKENANKFWQMFTESPLNKAVIIVDRNGTTTNPYVDRTQFSTVVNGTGVIIAESPMLGIEGCWAEFIEFIRGGIRQTCYHEDGFAEWLRETMGIRITYNDGRALIIERDEGGLRPCPFCSGTAKVVPVCDDNDSGYKVICLDCDAECGTCGSEASAVRKWNERT